MKKKTYLIGNAHIDPVWQWRWQDGMAEIKATFKSVLDRMNEFPDFKFTCAGSMYYEWIEKSDPKMFAEIAKRIKEGRWCVAGGWYLQPDCNIPSGESFARHALLAQNYFLNKFGVMAKTGYNVDSFGHNAGLPQVLKKSGLEAYVFMRPMSYEKELPNSLFLWEGHDGSALPAYRIAYAYEITNMERFAEWEKCIENETTDAMAFYGVGNHGGGPTIQLLNALHEKFDGDDSYSFSTVDEYFKDVDLTDLPVVSGNLQHHARGCYTAVTDIKMANRAAENNLAATEIFSAFSEILVGTEYPKDELQRAWKNVLFNQFHDILGGCIIQSGVKDAILLYGESLSIAERAINLSLQNISWQIDTLKGHTEEIFREKTFFPFTHEHLGSPVVIFNPLPFNAKLPVKIFPNCTRVEEENGDAVTFQMVRGEQTDGKLNHFNTLIYTEVPAFGYKVVRIFNKGEEKELPSVLSYGEDFIENEILRVTFDRQNGGIKSFVDKRNGQELLSGTTAACWFDDSGYDTWAHGISTFDKKEEEYGNAELQVIEYGAACVTMRVISRCGGFSLTQDYTLYAGEDMLRVEAKTSGCEKHKILRLAFPIGVTDARSLAEASFGVTEHPTDNTECPCGKWFAVTDGKEKAGVAILNNGKYGYSVDGATAYMTVLRTAIYCDHFGERDNRCEFMDTGAHTFRYALTPFKDKATTERTAYLLNFEGRAVLETFHSGSLKTTFSGIQVCDENVIVTAFKKAEDGNGYILRAYEAAGKETVTQLEIAALNVKTEIRFTPFEVKTLRIVDGVAVETNLIER